MSGLWQNQSQIWPRKSFETENVVLGFVKAKTMPEKKICLILFSFTIILMIQYDATKYNLAFNWRYKLLFRFSGTLRWPEIR